MKISKRVLSIMLAIITLVSVVSISAEAVTVKVANRKYGYMVPVNNKGTKVLSKVKLYGSYDYLNFFIHSGSSNVYFFYEIFSDKKLTKCVDSGYTVCSSGDYDMSEKIKLKGNFKSKTYYAVTYAGKFSSDKEKLTVDENSMCQFEIAVDRSPSYDEKEVMLKSVSNTADGPKITWSKISGTSKYYIYRRSITGTKFTKVGSVSGKKSSFVDTSAKKKDGNYIYTVKGINKKGVASQYHYNGITCLYAETPKITSVDIIEGDEITVKWKETDSKAKYYLYRKENNGNWKRMTTTSGDKYIDTNVKNGNEYVYRIKSVIESDYGKATSSYYTANKYKIKYLEAPVIDKLEILENSIGISWFSVDGVVGYSVLRKPLDSDDAWTVLGKVSGEQSFFEDETASLADGAYLYTVRSEGDGFSGSYSSGEEYVTLAQPEFTVAVDDDGVHIKWDKVPYATSYRVLEQQADGSWEIKKKTKKLYYNFKPSSYYCGKLTVYAVRSSVESAYKTDVEDIRYFPQINPEFAELETVTEIKWNSTFADSYRVYRKLKDTPDTDYELICETDSCSFTIETLENDVAYTYQIRGVYGDIEQSGNLVSKNHTRYSPETCIKNFNVYKEVEVFNRTYKSSDKKTIEYNFEVDKTDKFKKSSVKFYYWGDSYEGEGWIKTSGYSYIPDYEDFYDLIKPARFCCVVSTNSGNSTPLGVNTVYVEDETCEAPEVTLTPTSNGLKMTWDAVDDAVEYDVAVYFSERSDYKKTFKADGSKTYTVNFKDISYDYNIYLTISAVHKNGNKTTRIIDDYALYPKPKLVAAVPDNYSDGIDLFWSSVSDEGYFAVFRKAEGESKWTCISKKYYDYTVCSTNNGVEYNGFVYTDKKIKKGKKYTYTVRRYDPDTKEYISYYNTKGVSAKR